MVMVGRGDELEEVRRRVRSAAGGLAVYADHGGGLTTFVDALDGADHDEAAVVLRGRGRRSESHLTRALLRELAAADADGELGRALNEATDAELGEALLEWVANAGPTTVVVDDLHLADEPSRTALEFLSRRAAHHPFVAVLGTHEALDLPTVALPPLAIDELVAVVTDRDPAIDAGVARRVAEVADGSPLLAVEIARSLTDPQRRGTEPLPPFPVVSAPIEHQFDETLRSLPEATRRALCVAAAEPTGELRVVAAALGRLGDDVGALAPAEDLGVFAIADGRIEFDHPLRRSVAYRQLAPASRRAAHLALAEALADPADAERRAAHLVVGMVVPDEHVAADLEFVAVAAGRRGDHLEAARWWDAASRLTPDEAEARRRRDEAADARRPRTDPIAGLTKAERRVAAVVGAGATNKAAAETLYVSVKTIDAHLQSIYRKLGITSRAELAVLMTRIGVDAEPGREGAA